MDVSAKELLDVPGIALYAWRRSCRHISQLPWQKLHCIFNTSMIGTSLALESRAYCIMTLCRFINGMKAQHTPLKDARIVFYGAGSSAVGVATMIAQLISKETGMPFDEAKKVCYPAPPL